MNLIFENLPSSADLEILPLGGNRSSCSQPFGLGYQVALELVPNKFLSELTHKEENCSLRPSYEAFFIFFFCHAFFARFCLGTIRFFRQPIVIKTEMKSPEQLHQPQIHQPQIAQPRPPVAKIRNHSAPGGGSRTHFTIARQIYLVSSKNCVKKTNCEK